jgi:hypothetical protein
MKATDACPSSYASIIAHSRKRRKILEALLELVEKMPDKYQINKGE